MSSNKITSNNCSNISLNIVTALACEAKPLIDFYRLKKRSTTGFDHFCAQANTQHAFNINLVVSGIGSVNMLQACAWLAAKTERLACAWLNIGTAGHISLKLGSLVQVVHSVDLESSRGHYPPMVVNLRKTSSGEELPHQGVSLLSSNSPISDYPAHQAVDMEAYSFFLSAKRFASSELVQSLKIISDNQEYAIELLDAARISELVVSQIEVIDEFIQSLTVLVPPPRKEYPLSHENARLHCTVSQMAQYQDLMNKLDSIQLNTVDINAELADASSMAQVLKRLKSMQLTIAPTLSLES